MLAPFAPKGPAPGLVKGADGEERELALVRVVKQTAYVCPLSKYQQAMDRISDLARMYEG